MLIGSPSLMKYACPGAVPPGTRCCAGQDEPVNQVVHVRVVQLGVLAADQHLDVSGQHALEQLAEHGLVAAAPDAAGPDRAGQHAANAVLRQHESLGDDLGLGVEIVESLGVGQGFVAAGDALAAHHHAVGRGVDEPLDAGGLAGVHQVLGAADVDREAALTVLVGDRRAAHQIDDRRGVEDGVDAVDGGRDGVLVADVALRRPAAADGRAAGTARGRTSAPRGPARAARPPGWPRRSRSRR